MFCLALRRAVLGVFALSLLTTLPSAPAKADSFLNDWLPQVFGERDKGPKPEETLQAPFATGSAAARPLTEAEKEAAANPENMVPLNQPHRATKYIGEWAAATVAGAMSLEPATLNEHLDAQGKTFIPQALEEFKGYLSKTGILASLQVHNQQMQAFVGGDPTLLNEGVFQDSYRWLYDVPLTVTVMPSGTKTYKGNESKTSTQKLTVRIQIGRAKGPGAPDGMAIEHWTVLGAS